MSKQDDTTKTGQGIPDEAAGKSGEIVSEAAPQYKRAGKALPFEEGKRYTYSDYITWGDDVRCELICGFPVVMDAPSRKHQKALGKLFRQLDEFLDDKPCEVYVAPFDVRLNAEEADDIVVQPDVLVVCDHKKLTDAGCVGAPDLAIEVLSPGSMRHDRLTKMLLYERAGVREYWIVDVENKAVTAYILQDGRYVVKDYIGADAIPVHVLKGCTINLQVVFAWGEL